MAPLARHLRNSTIAPEMLCRIRVTQSIDLLALKGRAVRISGAVSKMVDERHSGLRLGETLGMGVYNATRGFGGITARGLRMDKRMWATRSYASMI
jgi:hypothetical protein